MKSRLGRRLALVSIAMLAMLASACKSPDEPPAQGGGEPAAPPWFEEVSRESGLDFVCLSGAEGEFLFPEIVLGGGGLLDMDADGDLDVYLVQGGKPDGKPAEAGNRLFRNDGDGRFEDISERSGADDRGYGIGVTAGDYDNDGDVDLYVTNVGPNTLLQNDGNGSFTDVTTESGTGDPNWGNSAAFLDIEGDGDLDLFVTNYISWSAGAERTCYNSSGARDYCLPTNYDAPAMDRLYRNDGDGTFTDITVESGVDRAFGNGMGVVPGDFDGDGKLDVFVANDTMENQLWMNRGDGRFEDEAALRGCALDEHGKTKAGMGVAAVDFDDDDDLDLLVVNMMRQSDSLFRNQKGFFMDRTAVAGLAVASRPFTRFGVGLIDFDNDGYLDLYQANGHVVLSPEPMTDDPFAQPNVVLRGTATGRFKEIEPRGGTREDLIFTSRAAVFGDLNNDGGIDVLVVNRDGPAHLLRNVVEGRGHWLTFRVLDEYGRDALGASLTLEAGGRTLRRDVQPAYSYCASNDPRVHFGLGDATDAASVTVRWLDGTREAFDLGGVDQILELRRGAGTPSSD